MRGERLPIAAAALSERPLVSRPTHRLVLLALLAVAAWLRLRAIEFGLPFPFAAIDEHLVTDHAIEFTTGDLNPHYFAYPSGSFALHALAYLGAFALGPHPTLASFRDAFWTAPQELLLLSRWLTAAIAVATVALAARLGAELARAAGLRSARRPAAWCAAAALATSYLHAANSWWVTVDAPMIAVATLALVLALRHLRRGGRGSAAGAAIAVGLAAGFKYYGALFAIAIAVAVAARAYRERAPIAGRLVVAALWCVGAFLATSPYVVLDASTFARDFAELRKHMEGGHFGHDPTRSGLAVYSGHLIGPWIGGWLLAPAALGILIAIGRRGGRFALLAVLLPAAVHFALITRFKAQPVDYLLGVVPALVGLAGVAAAALAHFLARRTPRPIAPIAVVLCLAPFALGARHAFDRASALQRPDTRVAARDWIERNVAPGTLVAADSWLDLELTSSCLEQMRAARARELARRPGEPPAEVPTRRPRDEPLAALDAKLAAARRRPPVRAYDFGYLTPVEVALRDELFALIREQGGRYVVLDGSRATRAEQTGGELRELAAWYRRHLEGPMVIARFDPADGACSGPPLAILDLTLPLAPPADQ